MKYFKVFNTENEYLEYISSDKFIAPNISTLYDSTKTWIFPGGEVVRVTGVTLSESEITVDKDETYQLVATVLPSGATDKSVTWSSSNENIATVDSNGVVSGVASGDATITVTTVDRGYTAQCSVSVTSVIHVTSVSLNKATTEIKKGETEQLTVTVLPANATDKSVTWSSSDPTIATVSNDGTITAVGCGSATITVTTTDGGYTAQCATSVVNPVTGVTLDKNIIYIKTGNTYQLDATVSPSDACGDKSVSWSSSDSSIVSVSNDGLVTAVASGSAVITVTTTVGSYTATCTVEVSEPVAVTSVTLDISTLDITVGQTRQLIATVLPSDAYDKSVTWSSSNSNIATVTSNGLVTAVSAGTANIIVTTTDGGFTAQCAVTITDPGFTSMVIEGASVVSAETCQYRAICDNTEDVTSSATWSITAGSQYATINSR